MDMNPTFTHHFPSDLRLLTLSSAHPPPPTSAKPSRKKRTKFIRIVNSFSGDKPRPAAKKPDPSAPKITRPCTECGKKFWSWKALFGHMRCHPERKWRGINPPPHFRRRSETDSAEKEESSVTEEDHEVATCLLMLANGPAAASDQSPSITTVNQAAPEYSDSGRFECSSCKKVFGSHQALGGHRASHKNVKGCYAITKNYDGEDHEGCCSLEMMMIKDINNTGHKCGICFRVFSSGQALGGHMRCHWEKVEDPSRLLGLDLNVAAPPQDDDDASCPAEVSGGVALDLRLGL